MNKLKDRAGQTLLETLASILIIALSLGFLSTALVTAGKLRQKSDGSREDFSYAQAQTREGSLTVDGKTPDTPVTVYYENGYYFYESDPQP